MELRKPEEGWPGDLGRTLPPEEVEQVRDSITPPHKIKSKCCRAMTDNSAYPVGRGRMPRGRDY